MRGFNQPRTKLSAGKLFLKYLAHFLAVRHPQHQVEGRSCHLLSPDKLASACQVVQNKFPFLLFPSKNYCFRQHYKGSPFCPCFPLYQPSPSLMFTVGPIRPDADVLLLSYKDNISLNSLRERERAFNSCTFQLTGFDSAILER